MTEPREPHEIILGLEDGTPISEDEVINLAFLAVEGEKAIEKLEALEKAMRKVGYFVIDISTDDTDGTVLELHKVDPNGP